MMTSLILTLTTLQVIRGRHQRLALGKTDPSLHAGFRCPLVTFYVLQLLR